jgi:phage-related baseplate assembly protein
MSESNISNLPPPDILQPVDYEAVLAEMRSDLVELAPELTAVLAVESEPITKMLEIMAYWRIHDRQMVNDAVKSNLLSFARGGDLDQLASFYDVARLAGETDEPFRNRLQANIKGWSPGSIDYYRFHALSVDPTIQGAYAASPESGLIRVAVLFAGETDETLLTAVRDRLTNPAVRLLTDRVEVVAAILIPVSVQADIWLRPDSPPGVMDTINSGFPELFNKSRSLGWNLAKSWIIAALHISGVKRVELTAPTDDIDVASDQCVELTGFEIVKKGVEW